jgi:uncharacterized protein (DUF2249 family)
MQISSQTRLSEVLDLDPRVVDYIVSLKPELFERLHHPTMRRVMAQRVTVGRVAAMAQVPTHDVLQALAELADVTVDASPAHLAPPQSPRERPTWLDAQHQDAVQTLDLRVLHDDLAVDLLPIVLRAVKALAPGEVLCLTHRWEPQPLYDIWATMKGIEWFADQRAEDEWRVWVRRAEG